MKEAKKLAELINAMVPELIQDWGHLVIIRHALFANGFKQNLDDKKLFDRTQSLILQHSHLDELDDLESAYALYIISPCDECGEHVGIGQWLINTAEALFGPDFPIWDIDPFCFAPGLTDTVKRFPEGLSRPSVITMCESIEENYHAIPEEDRQRLIGLLKQIGEHASPTKH